VVFKLNPNVVFLNVRKELAQKKKQFRSGIAFIKIAGFLKA